MKENLLATYLVVVFTLIYSCSDNVRQKKMYRDLEKAFSGAEMARNMLSENQNFLEASFSDKSKRHGDTFKQANFLFEEELWNKHVALLHNHRSLVEQVENLFNITTVMQERRTLMDLEENEIIRLHVQIVDLMKQSRKIVNRHKTIRSKYYRGIEAKG